MRVYHGRSDITMSQHLLNSADIVISLQEVGSEAVAEGMGDTRFIIPAFLSAFLFACCTWVS